MGFLLLILRPVASLVLGLVIFFGFLGFLLASGIRDNFLTDDFYSDNLAENDVYNRFYDEVLLDPEFEDRTDDLLGDIDIPQGEVSAVAREIVPPEYLREQVEGSITGTIDYLNKETDTPEVFIDLGVPLKRVEPAIFRYIDGRIDGLEDVPVTTIEEMEEGLEDLYRTLENGEIPTSVPSVEDPDALVDRYVDRSIAGLEEVPARSAEEFKTEVESIYKGLASGELPTTIPSVESIPVEDRLAAYDQALAILRESEDIPPETLSGLEEQEERIKDALREGSVKGALEVASPELTGPVVDEYVDDAYDIAYQRLSEDGAISDEALRGLDEQEDAIKESLGAGDTKEALKAGARGLLTPLIDEALGEIREDLDDRDRLDLVEIAAEQNDQTREELLEDLETARGIVEGGDAGFCVGIVMVVLGVVFMAAVQIPRLSSALRWPGLTLLLSGLVFLVITLVAKSQLPQAPLDPARASAIPPSMVRIMNDVFASMASDVATEFITLSVTIMVIGAVMLVGSFVIGLLRVPFLSR